MKKFLKAILPVKLKNHIAYHIHYIKGYKETKHLYEKDKNRKRIFIIGTPCHGNLGDHAIAYAQLKLVRDYFKDYAVMEISSSEIVKHLRRLKETITKDDIIIMPGGGNMGDEYIWEEEDRRKIISNFPDNKIIIFPQTIYFKKSPKGEKELQKSKNIYNSHKNLTVIAREKVSFKTMKEAFSNNNVILTPDIVIYLNKTNPEVLRKGALLCMRNDSEAILSKEQREDIKNTLQIYYANIAATDTTVNYMVDKAGREKELNNKWKEFKSSELVITDRLHGMVFAAITSTPCIVISNYNHKVKGTYEWLQHLNYIRFVDKVEEIDRCIKELKNVQVKPYDNSFAEEYYKQIIDIAKTEGR